MLNKSSGRPRPALLRALGKDEPPQTVEIEGHRYLRRDVFKHDSWAATAVYILADENCADGDGLDGSASRMVVCKFNRQSPILILPMKWLGRWLARRETGFLASLWGVRGIPRTYTDIRIGGAAARHVSAHEFIPGQPLSLTPKISDGFFDQLESLLEELHARRIAYIDLHKQENVIVGDDGLPYLMDFQVSIRAPRWRVLDPWLRTMCQCDRYHVAKHRAARGQFGAEPVRPWIIRIHRMVGVPLRTLRRKCLVWLGVRRGRGHAASELTPEVGLRH